MPDCVEVCINPPLLQALGGLVGRALTNGQVLVNVQANRTEYASGLYVVSRAEFTNLNRLASEVLQRINVSINGRDDRKGLRVETKHAPQFILWCVLPIVLAVLGKIEGICLRDAKACQTVCNVIDVGNRAL